MPPFDFSESTLQQTVLRPGRAYNVAISATSAASPNPTPVGVAAIRVVPSVNAWVTIARSSPTASVGNGSWFLPARGVEYFLVTVGDTVAVISDDTNTGTLNLVEMTR